MLEKLVLLSSACTHRLPLQRAVREQGRGRTVTGEREKWSEHVHINVCVFPETDAFHFR